MNKYLLLIYEKSIRPYTVHFPIDEIIFKAKDYWHAKKRVKEIVCKYGTEYDFSFNEI